MKKFRPFSAMLLFVLMPFLLVASGPQVQEVQYTDAWAESGFNLIQSTGNSVIVTFSVDRFTIREVTINGELMHAIELPGVFLPSEAGAPNLPGSGRYIAMPQGSTPVMNIINMRTATFKGLNVAPAPIIPLETEDGLEYSKNELIYSLDGLYPASPVQLGQATQIRGVDAVMLGVTPFQYNPSTDELTVIRDVTVEISFKGSNGTFGEDRLRSRWWDPILRDVFLNSSSLSKVDYSARGTKDQGYEYLIITPDNPQYLAWADSIKQWRSVQGIKTGIVTLTDIGSNTTSAIEAYINNAYNTWSIPPVAVLLMADYGTGSTTSTGINSPTYNNYCISDHIYADVIGNDHMAEIAFARMTAQTEAQLAIMVKKFIDYETSPPTSPSFYSNPVTAMGYQTERWFQLCSEVVNGFLEYGLGKTPVRENAVYSGSPGGAWSTATNTATVVNYFGPTGLGYIPASTSHLTDWGGNATRVNADLNSGAFMLQHRDHGSEGGWGEPDYGTSDLSGLNNNDLPFIFSVNCLTGKFDHSTETFAEAFHRYPKRALGIIAATEVSYSFVNDAYVWGLYDYMWPEFMPAYGTPGEHSLLPAFGNVAGKLFLQQSSWPYNTSNKEVTYYLFHHHGDAFTTVYSEVPQYLTVVHNPVVLAGVNTFDVSADSGALICLSYNGEILSTATGNGSPISMSIIPLLPGDNLVVTITKQDYYRYSQTIQVIPPTGPYVIREDVVLNDANQNGQADYSEEVLLSLQMKNVGIMAANNVTVTISCNEPWIDILDSSELYGNIGPDSSMVLVDAFKISVADSIADGYKANFMITATDGSDTWNSSFFVNLHAPVLSIPGLTIIDTAGNNNGLPEPGETVTVHVDAFNSGSAEAFSAEQYLMSTSPYIQITGSPSTFASLQPSNTYHGEFTVSIDAATPDGSILDMICHLNASPYATDNVFFHPVGEVNEDFETGNLNKYSWVTGGNSSWIVTNQLPYEGLYTARSGSLGHNASTYLQITLDVLVDDNISFYRKVSSEANYDYLEFYIDGVKMGSWSGNQAWALQSYPVTFGTHTFKWVYDKDVYATGGSDMAWIDYIKFPPIIAPGTALEVRATALDNSLCQGESTSLYAIASGGSASTYLQWSPATSLNNSSVYNPVASPVGTTNYRVIAVDGAAKDTAFVNVAVNPNPIIKLVKDTSVCADAVVNLDATVPAGVDYSWTPVSGNTAMVSVDSSGIGFGSTTYTVIATDAYGCKGDASTTITFVDCAGIDELSGTLGVEIYPNPSSGMIYVKVRNNSSNTQVRLLDINGSVLKYWQKFSKQAQMELDLNGFSAGMYLLNITSDKGSETLRIVIQ